MRSNLPGEDCPAHFGRQVTAGRFEVPRMQSDRLAALLLLSQVEGVGWARYQSLVRAFGDERAVLAAKEKELLEVRGIGPKTAAGVVSAGDFDAGKEISEAVAEGVSIVPFYSPSYPGRLLEIHNPPLVLFVRGRPESLSLPSVAVVGTRQCTHYGRRQSFAFAAALAGAGLAVVSGLARGVDTAAHEAALEAGGATVAVLGSGVLNVYPAENSGLADRICEKGAVVSEFPLRARPDRSNFPRRNRIISGLSLGVLVVEASLRSGALLTARWALEQNREVFAVPGRTDSAQSMGTNALIARGAKIACSVDDVLDELPPGTATASPARSPGTAAPPALTSEEQAVLDSLKPDPACIEEISEITGIAVEKVASALFFLEMKRIVRQLPGGVFESNQRAGGKK